MIHLRMLIDTLPIVNGFPGFPSMVEYSLNGGSLVQDESFTWPIKPRWHGGFRHTTPPLKITVGMSIKFDVIFAQSNGGPLTLDPFSNPGGTVLQFVSYTGAKIYGSTTPASLGGWTYLNALELYDDVIGNNGSLQVVCILSCDNHPRSRNITIGGNWFWNVMLMFNCYAFIGEDNPNTKNICFGTDNLVADTRSCRPSSQLISAPIWSVFAHGPEMIIGSLETKLGEPYPSIRQSGHVSNLSGSEYVVQRRDHTRYSGAWGEGDGYLGDLGAHPGRFWPPLPRRSDFWSDYSALLMDQLANNPDPWSRYDWALSYRGLALSPVNRGYDACYEWLDQDNGYLPLTPSDLPIPTNPPDPRYLENYHYPRYYPIGWPSSPGTNTIIPETDKNILLYKSSLILSGKITLALHELTYTHNAGDTTYAATVTRGAKLDELVVYGEGMTMHPANDTWYEVPLPAAMDTAWFMEKAESNISQNIP